MALEIISEIKQDFINTPAGTVPAGSVLTYFKSDGKLYKKIVDTEYIIESEDNHSGFNNVDSGVNLIIDGKKEMIVTNLTVDGTLIVDGTLTIL